MEPPKRAVKRALRELAVRAHGEDLRRALLPVSAAFDEWRAGTLGSGDLAQVIHEFHDEPASELYKRYNGDHRWAVAHAIANGARQGPARGHSTLTLSHRVLHDGWRVGIEF
jgi:hypothetical protein